MKDLTKINYDENKQIYFCPWCLSSINPRNCYGKKITLTCAHGEVKVIINIYSSGEIYSTSFQIPFENKTLCFVSYYKTKNIIYLLSKSDLETLIELDFIDSITPDNIKDKIRSLINFI